MAKKTIKVDYLARVEGEGALLVDIESDKIKDVKLKIFEPPRFFEAFLRDRSFRESPDITARICGICPVAYQMSAVHAMENACGVKIDGPLRDLRRLLYCGEWIESHGLHIYMLHAPDFLGVPDAITMAKTNKARLEQGLFLKKMGNKIVSTVGGREIHPINVKVGGFFRAPHKSELRGLLADLRQAKDIALDTVEWVSTFDFPDYERDYEYVCLSHPDEYPFNEGRIVSNKGLDIAASEFDQHIEEVHVAHTNALQARIKARGSYLAGPLARFNLNFDKLTPQAIEAARRAGIDGGTHNPFKSIIVRAVETVFAFEEAIRIIEGYSELENAAVEVHPVAGRGSAATEAPRGLLVHHYEINQEGLIQSAKIIPPTSQNQKAIEEDLYQVVDKNIKLAEPELTHLCEQTIRNYDPCISCATHFLQLKVRRDGQ